MVVACVVVDDPLPESLVLETPVELVVAAVVVGESVDVLDAVVPLSAFAAGTITSFIVLAVVVLDADTSEAAVVVLEESETVEVVDVVALSDEESVDVAAAVELAREFK